MATHQSIGGMTDTELMQRMVNSHPERHGEAFWEFFKAHVGSRLPAHPVVIDLGCGPGLFLRDLATHHPDATLYGYDVTPAMIDYARQVAFPGLAPTFAVHDVTAEPIPLDTGSVHLVCMTAVLHVLDEPLPVLAKIRRVLAADGTFMLHDWVRSPLREYLASRIEGTEETIETSGGRWFRLFPAHNKYTEDDWGWLLNEAGFAVQMCQQLRAHFRMFVTTPVS